MTSTLCVRKTPQPVKDQWHFKLPVKALIARKFYNHDGSLGGGEITVGPRDLEWFEGILAAGSFSREDHADLEAVIQVLRDGGSIDMWFET